MSVALGYYRHYKGGRYRVLTTATHASTGETLVIYWGANSTWAREISSFTSMVTVGDKQVPRFAAEENP